MDGNNNNSSTNNSTNRNRDLVRLSVFASFINLIASVLSFAIALEYLRRGSQSTDQELVDIKSKVVELEQQIEKMNFESKTEPMDNAPLKNEEETSSGPFGFVL